MGPPTFTGTSVNLSWTASAGTTYRLQFKDALTDTNWTDVPPDVVATGPSASFTNAPAVPRRFYRVLVVN